jgi:type II secretory pathway component PulJ
MTELTIVSCVVSLSLLISAGLDSASESTRLEARRAQMQAEINHACSQPTSKNTGSGTIPE